MAKDALNHFANTLLEEAGVQKQEILSDLETRRTALLAQADAEIKQRSARSLKKGTAALKQQKHLSVSRRENELHKALLQNRQRTFESVFAKVAQNIRDFTETAEYQTYLETHLKEAISALADGDSVLVCTVMPKDLDALKARFSDASLQLEASKTDFIGGFTLLNPQKKQFIDGTLAARIQDQADAFHQTSGLTIG